MADIVDIADAIQTELEDGSFSLPFDVVRGYIPRYEREDLEGLTVTIVPKSVTESNQDRNRTQDEDAIDVAVQQKVASTEAAELDPLMSLAREIRRHFKGRECRARVKASTGASWIRSAHPFIYSPEHLREKRIFTSVITLTYKVTD
jgi:hypothetical protein